MPSVLALIEFPADDPERARSFWTELLGQTLQARTKEQGEGWQTDTIAQSAQQAGSTPAVGIHPRGRGPGDSFSLPYFEVSDMQDALARVLSLGGSVIHPGERWAICKDTEGSPFGLALRVQTPTELPEPASTEHDDLQRLRP